VQLISEMLKAGEEIIVQIAKEPLARKARHHEPRRSTGPLLVYMPTVDHIGVSRRIGSAEDRSRLRRVVTEAKGTFPGGFIVRTAAAGEAMTKSAPTWNFWAAPGTPSAPPPSSAGAFAPAPRPEPGRAHPARLPQRRLRRHLLTRRGIHQGRRICGPLPAEDGPAREAVHERGADLRGIRHSAGTRQACARKSG